MTFKAEEIEVEFVEKEGFVYFFFNGEVYRFFSMDLSEEREWVSQGFLKKHQMSLILIALSFIEGVEVPFSKEEIQDIAKNELSSTKTLWTRCSS